MNSKPQANKPVVLPVTVSGQWMNEKLRDWRGNATAAEPFVVLILLRHGNIIEWCKSERQTRNDLELRLALFPFDESLLEVQVNFSAGDSGRRYSSLLDSASYKPNVQAERVVNTGALMRFSVVEGKPKIDLQILFISQRDVKFGRKALWRPRSEITFSVPMYIARMLANGRAGQEDIG
jgi:hypothetical protein